MKVKISQIPALLFIYCVSCFYIIKESKLNFEGIRFLIIVAFLSAFIYLIEILKAKSKESMMLFVVFILIVTKTIISKDTRLLISFFAVFVSMRVNRRVLFKHLLYSHILFFGLALLTGGTGHINSVAMNVGTIIFIYIAANEGAIQRTKMIGLFIIYVVFCTYTKSGSFIICSGIALLLLLIRNKKMLDLLLCNSVVKYVFFITLIFNVVLCIIATSRYFDFARFLGANSLVVQRIVSTLDKLTSWRLTLGGESLHRYGISLMGGNIKYDSMYDGISYFQVDSGMLWLLQGSGVLISLSILSLFTLMMKTLIKNKNYNLIIIGLCIALWSVNEDIVSSINVNIMFFVLGEIISKNRFRRIEKYANS